MAIYYEWVTPWHLLASDSQTREWTQISKYYIIFAGLNGRFLSDINCINYFRFIAANFAIITWMQIYQKLNRCSGQDWNIIFLQSPYKESSVWVLNFEFFYMGLNELSLKDLQILSLVINHLKFIQIATDKIWQHSNSN